MSSNSSGSIMLQELWMSVSLGINWRNVEMYGDDKNVTPLFGCTIIPRIYYDTSQSVIPNFKLVSSMVASAYLSLRACFLLKIAEREDNFLASHFSHKSYSPLGQAAGGHSPSKPIPRDSNSEWSCLSTLLLLSFCV